MAPEIAARELKELLDHGAPIQLLDVREPEELRICALPGAENVPMLPLFAGLARPAADPGRPVVVYCHHGIRSADAVTFLRDQGFSDVRSLAGGIDAWAADVDPSMTRY
ncbi:MAG: rhodanese-like domain-containing protein [Planctomycetota bacterium]